MTSIPLHDYVEQVDKLIDSDRLVEAIEHCRHILHSYPRHIDTYRIMGKALLEKQEFDAATDIFLRILGADPNDFISYVGLSIINEEASQYDQALWYLERAYEIQPYNVAIQGELRKLYARQHETTRPGIIPLTQGALARLYMQGELYQQAIAELQRILAEEPSRMDLQVLLAEALWRDGQRIDAEEVCLSTLEELPNSIVLNAILAEIWLQTGRIPEAQKYLRRLQGLTQKTVKSLDKESIPELAFALDGAFSLPKETVLDFLQTGLDLPDGSDKPDGDWGKEVSFEEMVTDGDAVVLEPESGMHSYDWLADIEELGSEGETAVSADETHDSDWFSQDKTKEALNLATSELNAEWLADLRGEENEEDSSLQPLDLDGTIDEIAGKNDGETDWFADGDEISDEELAAFDVDLEETAVSSSGSEEEKSDDSLDWLDQLTEDDSPLEIDSTNLIADNLLDWDDSEEDDSEEDEDEPHVVDEPKTPFWLSEMADEELEAVQLNPEEALEWANEPEAESDLGDESGEMVTEAPSIADLEDQAPLPDGGELDDGDDWLASLTEGSIDEGFDWNEEPADEKMAIDLETDISTDELTALDEDDDWLQSTVADLDKISKIDELEEEEFPNLAIPELEGDDIVDVPDWLDNEDQESSEELEAAVSNDNDPQETPQPEKPEIEPTESQKDEEAGLDGLDWLDDLTPELDTNSDVLPEPPIETEGMPSWLEDANEDTAVEVVDEWESASAEIPDWLQEPIDLTDLDNAEAIEAKEKETDSESLTGLLSEMDVSDEAVGLDQMDSLFADWDPEAEADDDSDGDGDGLTDLLGGFSVEEVETVLDADELPDDEVAMTPEAEEAGLTGLLSSLTIEDDDTAVPGDDSMSDLFTDALDEDDDDDDWLADFNALTEDEAEPTSEADTEEEESLTGMLANLWPDEEADGFEETAVVDVASDDTSLDQESEPSDELGLTELLAGIDYVEDTIQSDPVFPDLDSEPMEPSLNNLLTEMGEESEDEADGLPISAEDTTWLNQLEADTGSLQEQEDEFDLAEESGLDWLTVPDDEPTVDDTIQQPEAELEETDEDEPDEPIELDGTAEDWDDAMSWLEELAAEQDEPMEELPSVAETVLDEELDTAEKLASTTPMDSGSLDWLDELTSDIDDSESSETAEEILDDETEPELVEFGVETEEDIFAGLGGLDEGDEISWLDELATDNLDSSVVVEEVETIIDPMEELSESINEEALLDELTIEESALDDIFSSGDTVIDEPESEAIAEEILDFSEVVLPLDEDETEPELVEFGVETEEDIFAGLGGLDEGDEISWLDELATDSLDRSVVVEEVETIIDPMEELSESVDEEALLDELTIEESALDDIFSSDDAVIDEPESEAIAEEILDFGEVVLPLDELDELEGIADADFGEEDFGWLDAIVDETAVDEPETTIKSEEADANIEELLPETELVVTGVTDALKMDSGIEEAESDLEEALAWLDDLDDDETDIEILDEAPTTLVDLPISEFETDVPEDNDVPETIIVTPEPNELTLALDRLEQTVLDEGVDVPNTAVFPRTLSTDELFAALDWIEAEEAVEEEPAVEIDEPVAETAVSDEDDLSLEDVSDDPEAWLNEMLSGDLDMDIEIEPPSIKPSEDAVFVTGNAPEEFLPDLDQSVEPAQEDELADVELEGLPDDPDAAIAWLDELASDGDSDDDVAEIEPDDLPDSILAQTDENDSQLDLDLDDPESWLEQMLGDDMSLDIEMEPAAIKPSEDAVFVTDDTADVAIEPEPEAEPSEPVVEAIDFAETAVEPGHTAVDDEPDLVDNLSDDPEAWLEQMLNDDMALDIEMEPAAIKPSEDAVFVTDDTADVAIEPEPEAEPSEPVVEAIDFAETAVEPEQTAVDDEPDPGDLSDDPEAWLEQMLNDDMALDIEMEPAAIKPSEDAVYVTDDVVDEDTVDDDEMLPETDLVSSPPVDASEMAETDIIADVPDDPDEAMAWLEQLAARQGAAMDELPSVTDAEAEPILPSWMEQDMEVFEDAVETAVSPDAPIEEETPEEETSDEDVASELPDWLDSVESEVKVAGETDWLRSLPEIDMETWLSAEEEATATGSMEEPPVPDTGPLSTPPQTSSTEDLDDNLFEPVMEPSTGAYSVDEAQLGVAQDAMSDGRLDDAVSQFKQLVTAGSGMMTIISELEHAAEDNPQKPIFYQVLGDAYMRNGQLQKALISYRSALNQM